MHIEMGVPSRRRDRHLPPWLTGYLLNSSSPYLHIREQCWIIMFSEPLEYEEIDTSSLYCGHEGILKAGGQQPPHHCMVSRCDDCCGPMEMEQGAGWKGVFCGRAWALRLPGSSESSRWRFWRELGHSSLYRGAL